MPALKAPVRQGPEEVLAPLPGFRLRLVGGRPGKEASLGVLRRQRRQAGKYLVRRPAFLGSLGDVGPGGKAAVWGADFDLGFVAHILSPIPESPRQKRYMLRREGFGRLSPKPLRLEAEKLT